MTDDQSSSQPKVRETKADDISTQKMKKQRLSTVDGPPSWKNLSELEKKQWNTLALEGQKEYDAMLELMSILKQGEKLVDVTYKDKIQKWKKAFEIFVPCSYQLIKRDDHWELQVPREVGGGVQWLQSKDAYWALHRGWMEVELRSKQ